jgi:glycosyltransferase involved in cell wall biosynthesis
VPGAWWSSRGLAARVAAETPAVVHINGLGQPRLVSMCRDALPHARIVVQDHAGVAPPQGPSPRAVLRRRLFASGLSKADAVFFTSADQATPWRACLGVAVVVPVVEASTRMQRIDHDEARRHTGLAGNPLVLWTGRLDPNKDPMTAVDAFALLVERLPSARLAMIFGAGSPLEPAVRARVTASPRLAAAVTLVGRVPHDRMPSFFSAADLYVSASHSEGSGYALIEAIACGVWPVVSAIPSFVAIAGSIGRTFTPGDAASCAAALADAAAVDRLVARRSALDHFARELSWDRLADRAMRAYRELPAR